MIKVMSIFGTRPEVIKMAPILKEMKNYKDIESRVVVTGQHRQMLDQLMKFFGITAHHDLDIMLEKQTLYQITERALKGIRPVLQEEKPDLVLVQGDTTTAFVAALGSFYEKIPVGHVEAGLRTDNIYEPFPEEINRRLITIIATIHFAPTRTAVMNLEKSGIKSGIYLTGNTVIDALCHILETAESTLPPEISFLEKSKSRILLVETHRRENLGEPIAAVCRALKRLKADFPDIEIVFSVHRNPAVREVVFPALSGISGIHLIDPVDYTVLVRLMELCYMVLTDSGGIQEEAPSLGKPVLVLRGTTERPEGITAGTAKLIGTREDRVYKATAQLLSDPGEYSRMSRAVNPYGDGLAAVRVVNAIRHHFGLCPEPPLPFTGGDHGN
ncbi:MAG: UDP-N-acetylglucosamine 2-epimerase (non-hydrolyzing) [Candidatus Eremiobacteraeota bacterium]|nr:UDP-N-acetylglucosamine 2-epimerase (non-hydrolyzing) [Candidatus Eremiobacteraeota bacterium]